MINKMFKGDTTIDTFDLIYYRWISPLGFIIFEKTLYR